MPAMHRTLASLLLWSVPACVSTAPDTAAALHLYLDPPTVHAEAVLWDSLRSQIVARARFTDGHVAWASHRITGADVLWVRAQGFLVSPQPLPEHHGTLDIVLPREPTIHGRLWLDGQPAAGVLHLRADAIEASLQSYAPDPYDPLWWEITHDLAVATDHQGRFALRGVPPGSAVSITMRGVDPSEPVTLVAPARDVELRFTRGRAGFLTGRVIQLQSVDDEPERRVTVRCVVDHATFGGLQVPDADVLVGDRFEIDLKHVRGQTQPRLEVMSPIPDRHLRLAGPMPLQSERDAVDVGDVPIDTDDRALDVVVTCGGTPLAHCDVTADASSRSQTDVQGRVRLRLPSEARHVTFAALGAVAACLPLPGDRLVPWRVDLAPARRLRIRVLPPPHAPMPPAFVRFEARLNGWEAWTGAYRDMQARASVPFWTDWNSNGTVLMSCVVPDHGVIDVFDLHGEQTEVTLILPGLGAAAECVVDPDTMPDEDIVLACPSALELRSWQFIDPQGHPVPGVVAQLETRERRIWRVRSDAMGHAMLPIFGDDPLQLRILQPEVAPITGPGADTHLHGGRVTLPR